MTRLLAAGLAGIALCAGLLALAAAQAAGRPRAKREPEPQRPWTPANRITPPEPTLLGRMYRTPFSVN